MQWRNERYRVSKPSATALAWELPAQAGRNIPSTRSPKLSSHETRHLQDHVLRSFNSSLPRLRINIASDALKLQTQSSPLQSARRLVLGRKSDGSCPATQPSEPWISPDQQPNAKCTHPVCGLTSQTWPSSLQTFSKSCGDKLAHLFLSEASRRKTLRTQI